MGNAKGRLKAKDEDFKKRATKELEKIVKQVYKDFGIYKKSNS